MTPHIDAWFVLIVALAARLNREKRKALDYAFAENRVLKEQLKARGRRITFTDKQRRLLAAKAKELGRAALKKLDGVVTPATLLRWHRQLIAHDLRIAEQSRRIIELVDDRIVRDQAVSG